MRTQAGLRPVSIALDPTSRFARIANAGSNDISSCRIDCAQRRAVRAVRTRAGAARAGSREIPRWAEVVRAGNVKPD